jgi:hypothetical protein
MYPLLRGAAITLLVSGCVTAIAQQNPRPNVALVPQDKSLRLDLRNIPKQFDIVVGNNTLRMEQWDVTLRQGFRNGIASNFHNADNAQADFVLLLNDARLEVGDFDHSRARVQFKASLIVEGKIVRGSAGTAFKASPAFTGPIATERSLLAADINGAVEAMYEQIAKEIFATPLP